MESSMLSNRKIATILTDLINLEINNVISGSLDIKNDDDFVIVKRNKKLRDGDYALLFPKRLLRDDEISKLTNAFKTHHSQLFSHFSNNRLFLNRALIMQMTISSAVGSGDQFGNKPMRERHILVNPSAVTEIDEELTLDNIRALLLSQHVSALLNAEGHQTEYIARHLPESVKEVMALYGINMAEFKTDLDKERRHVYSVLSASEYAEKMGSTCIFNFDNESSGVSQSSSKIEASETSKIIQDIERLVAYAEENCHCIHLTHVRKQFQNEQCQHLWALYNRLQAKSVKQSTIVYGSVASQDKTAIPNARNFYRLRYNQMLEASVMKYGECVREKEWEQTINVITRAGIKFEFLSMVAHQQANLDFKNHESASQGNKGGVFVMYNCARLSTLFANYEKAVNDKYYPSLPPVDEVDFSTLQDEEEWSLVYNYVLVYPHLISSCVSEDFKIQTHKVCQFILDLCRDLSSYYSRTHVLGEPRTHLLPLMFARLYLLRSIYIVLTNALLLFNITPLTQL